MYIYIERDTRLLSGKANILIPIPCSGLLLAMDQHDSPGLRGPASPSLTWPAQAHIHYGRAYGHQGQAIGNNQGPRRDQ